MAILTRRRIPRAITTIHCRKGNEMTFLRTIASATAFLVLASISSHSNAGTVLVTRAEDGKWCMYKTKSLMMDAVSKTHFLFYASANLDNNTITQLTVHMYGDEYDVFTTDRYLFSSESQDYSVKRLISAPSDSHYHKSFSYKFHADKLLRTPAGDGIYDDIIKTAPYPRSYFNIFDLAAKFSTSGGDVICE